jgi:hypothetical protein
MIKVLPWGSHTWHAIHYVALGYPDDPGPQDVENYRTFFSMLGYVLPCKLCTGHYYENLKAIPIDLTSREALFAWTVALHNSVNRSLGRTEWTVDQAKAYLFSDAAAHGCPSSNPSASPSSSSPSSSSSSKKYSTLTIVVGTAAAAAVIGGVAWYVWKQRAGRQSSSSTSSSLVRRS